MCHWIEESLLKVRAEVEPLTSQLVQVEGQNMEYVKMVQLHTAGFLRTLEEVVGTIRKAITFMLMKVSGSVCVCVCVCDVTILWYVVINHTTTFR